MPREDFTRNLEVSEFKTSIEAYEQSLDLDDYPNLATEVDLNNKNQTKNYNVIRKYSNNSTNRIGFTKRTDSIHAVNLGEISSE